MTTDWPDWQPHPHMALAQYTQGVPLARKPTNISNASVSIPISTPTTLFSNAMLDQPSWQLVLFTMQAGAPANTPFARLRFQWTDAASAFTAETDWVIVPFGNVSNVVTIVTGPTRMDELTVIADSLDPAAPLNLSFSLTQHSQVYDQIRVQEVNLVTVAGFTRPGGDPQVGILGSTAAVIGPLAAIQRLEATWAGKSSLCIDNSANANAVRVRLLDPGIVGGGTALYGMPGAGIIATKVVTASDNQTQEIELPNGPVIMEAFNLGNAGNITPQICLTRLDR